MERGVAEMCPDCKRTIKLRFSGFAPEPRMCPHCGAYVTGERATADAIGGLLMLLMLIGAIIAHFLGAC